MASRVELLQNELAQLEKEVRIDRMKTSETTNDIVQYCQKHQQDDRLLRPLTVAENPYKEKKSCIMLWTSFANQPTTTNCSNTKRMLVLYFNRDRLQWNILDCLQKWKNRGAFQAIMRMTVDMTWSEIEMFSFEPSILITPDCSQMSNWELVSLTWFLIYALINFI